MSVLNENQNKSNIERKALGRGLAALLGSEENSQPTQTIRPTGLANLSMKVEQVGGIQIAEVELSKIEPNPEQPRKHFNQALLEELALSLKEHGLVQPIIVKKLPNQNYQIIAGERRWRASKLAGLSKIPVVIREASKSTQSNDLASLIENIQREDLSPIELANSYDRMLKIHGFTQEALAQKLGISRVAVANTLRLLKLPETVRDLVSNKRLTEGHSRALLALENESQIVELANDILELGLSVRDVEARVKQIQESNATTQKTGISTTSSSGGALKKEEAFSNIKATLEDELRQLLGTKVSIRGNEARGTLEIYYVGKDSLNRIVHQLRSTEV